MELFNYLLVLSFTINLTYPQKPGDKSAKILGGSDCDTDIHKFMVLIRTGHRHKCGGTLINRNWVLTASHCCHYRMWVIAGISKNPESQKIKVDVKQCYQHPSYEYDPLNDIALLKLAKPIDESEHVKYVKIPNQTVNQFCVEALTMGWGRLTYPKRTNNIPTHIQCVMVPLISARRCKILYPAFHPSEICSLSFEGKDACAGDSGGPLLCNDMQVGVVVYGIGCGLLFKPGVYVRVDYYLDFIDHVMLNYSNILTHHFYEVLLVAINILAYFLYS